MESTTMPQTENGFAIFDAANAPEKSRKTVEAIGQAFGMVPNMIGVLAGSPALVNGYAALGQLGGQTGFTAAEQETAIIAISAANGCNYCSNAHGTMALGKGLFDCEALRRIIAGESLDDARLEAVRAYAAEVAQTRGAVSAEARQAFHSAGFDQSHELGIVFLAAMKTMTNYSNNLAGIPVENAFTSWQS